MEAIISGKVKEGVIKLPLHDFPVTVECPKRLKNVV
jgi:hypothetical protein